MKVFVYSLLIVGVSATFAHQTMNTKMELSVFPTIHNNDSLVKHKTTQQSKKKVGEVLFNSILDTIKVKPLSTELLKTHNWFFRPFEMCSSSLTFLEGDKGTSYNCEMNEEYEMNYQIKENRLHISEFEIPLTDNPEKKKIKFRDDTYIYNGNALVLVGSKMYNIVGQEWTPKIEVVINYNKEQKP